VIDYLENLGDALKKSNKLENIDYSWTVAKQISETAPRLVLTAHQSNKEGFKSWVLTRNNFRGNLKILAHPSGIFGINHTDEEKRMQVWRFNCIARREGGMSESNCCTIASCLDYGHLIKLSNFNP